MASRSFLLLALAFAVVLLIASEVAAAKELASDNNNDINDNIGRGGYIKGGGHGGHNKYDVGHRGHGGHNKGGGGRGGHDNEGGRGGHALGAGHPIVGGHKGCKLGRCCGVERHISKECKCCSTVEEANAYKQTQN